MIDPDAPKKPKLDRADTIQKELLEDMLNYIKSHPYSKVLESALEEGDLNLADLENVIKKDKLKVVTGEEKGLKNFETLIQKYFDTIETRLTDFHNNIILKALEQAKKDYLKDMVGDLCNSLSTQLTLSQRDELLSRPEFASKLVTFDTITKEKQLSLNATNVDTVIDLQRAIADLMDDSKK